MASLLTRRAGLLPAHRIAASTSLTPPNPPRTHPGLEGVGSGCWADAGRRACSGVVYRERARDAPDCKTPPGRTGQGYLGLPTFLSFVRNHCAASSLNLAISRRRYEFSSANTATLFSNSLTLSETIATCGSQSRSRDRPGPTFASASWVVYGFRPCLPTTWSPYFRSSSTSHLCAFWREMPRSFAISALVSSAAGLKPPLVSLGTPRQRRRASLPTHSSSMRRRTSGPTAIPRTARATASRHPPPDLYTSASSGSPLRR